MELLAITPHCLYQDQGLQCHPYSLNHVTLVIFFCPGFSGLSLTYSLFLGIMLVCGPVGKCGDWSGGTRVSSGSSQVWVGVSRWMLYNTPRKVRKMTSSMVTQHVTLYPSAAIRTGPSLSQSQLGLSPQSDGRTHVKAPSS